MTMRRRGEARAVPPSPTGTTAWTDTQKVGLLIDDAEIIEEESPPLPPLAASSRTRTTRTDASRAPIFVPPQFPVLAMAILLVVSAGASSDGRQQNIVLLDGPAAVGSSNTADRPNRRRLLRTTIRASPTPPMWRAAALQANDMDGYPAEVEVEAVAAAPVEEESSSSVPNPTTSVVPNTSTSSGGANYPVRGGATSTTTTTTIHTHDTPAAGTTLISPTGEVVDHRRSERERRDFYEFVAFVCWYFFLIVCCIVPTVCVYRRRLRREREVLRELEEAQRIGLSVLRMRSSGGGGAGGEGAAGRQVAQSWSLAIGAVGGLVPPVTEEWRRKRRALLDEQWERSSMIVTEAALYPERVSSNPSSPPPRRGAPEKVGGGEGDVGDVIVEGSDDRKPTGDTSAPPGTDDAADGTTRDENETSVRKCPPSIGATTECGDGGGGGGFDRPAPPASDADGGSSSGADADADARKPSSPLELDLEVQGGGLPPKDASWDDDHPDSPGSTGAAGEGHGDPELDGSHGPVDIEDGLLFHDDYDCEDDDADPPPALLHLPATVAGGDGESDVRPLVNGGPRSVPNSCAICLCPYEVGCTVTWSSIVATSPPAAEEEAATAAADGDDGGGDNGEGDGDGDGQTSSPSSATDSAAAAATTPPAQSPAHPPSYSSTTTTQPMCPHAFHRSCIEAWCMKKLEEDPGRAGSCPCPCCRQEFVRLDESSLLPVASTRSASSVRHVHRDVAREGDGGRPPDGRIVPVPLL